MTFLSDIVAFLAFLLGIGAALAFLLRIQGPTEAAMTVFLRIIALCLFAGALFAAGTALFYAVLGLALGISGALVPFGAWCRSRRPLHLARHRLVAQNPQTPVPCPALTRR